MMRGLWAVLVCLLMGPMLLGAPDLDVIETSPTVGSGPVEIEPLERPVDGVKSSSSDSFLGVSVPAVEEVAPEEASSTSSSVLTERATPALPNEENKSFGTMDDNEENAESELLDKEDPEDQPLDLISTAPERMEYQPMGQLAMLGVLATLFGTLFLWVWYRKQIRGKIQPNARLPMQVLGQTWLDGQSKILTLRVGSKILIVAKSAQYCTTLDVITDPDEVNLITLGGGQDDDDFQKILKAVKADPKDIPDAEGIQADLKELKRQLGTLKGQGSS